VGTHGRINWDYADMASMFTIGNDTPRRQFVMLGEQSFGQEVAAFVDCVERDVPPPISGEQALETLRIALAAHESLETGRAVVLGERYHGQRS
jgi:predicted dehydrogenase